jgi:UDP-N-acetylmuramoyl-L-alanyl-D-glutamate--2,6-diaminopimelate ligase
MQIKNLFPQKLKNIYHLGQAGLANFLYGHPSKDIKIIGVTGTNGKTTTCQMIAKILEEAGHKVAMASTINFKLGKKEWVNKTKFTTLSSFQIQKFIKEAVENECNYLVLEVSSHSLDQYRVAGIKFRTAVITNTTREHLDYHGTMTGYRLAKIRLFEDIKVAVVNLDMEKPEEFLEFGEEKYGYSTQNAKRKTQSHNLKLKAIIAENINLGIDHSLYQIQDTRYKIQLPGLFNIENALAATCAGMAENISLETIRSALEKIKGVPGRLEHVPNDKDIDIIIDYAVTPDSLEKLYFLIDAMRKSKNHPERSEGSRDSSTMLQNDRKIIAVFGACGERDRGKRPIMGEIVSRAADRVIVTNEDPYFEDPGQIIDEVFAGVVRIGNRSFANAQDDVSYKEENVNCWRIMDRREAIKKALQLAKPGDIVVVTGKGAEETMAVGKKRIPWNDKKVILEELEKI